MASTLDKYVSVSQAARKLGVSRQWVYQLIREGKIKSREVAGKKVIHVGQLGR